MVNTELRDLQDLVARSYAAMEPDTGSNDEEHECLWQFVEYAEEAIRRMGGELPPKPEDD